MEKCEAFLTCILTKWILLPVALLVEKGHQGHGLDTPEEHGDENADLHGTVSVLG